MTRPSIQLPHTSVAEGILHIAQEAADQAAYNAVIQLADWLEQEGHPDLAHKMLSTFIEQPSENPVADPDQFGRDLETAEPEAETPAPAQDREALTEGD